MRTIGENIREIREKADMTLKEVSENTGVSISFLSDIERGRTLPSLKTLQKLANMYKYNLAVFLTDVYIEEVPSPYRDFNPGEVDPTNKGNRDTYVWFINNILNERERRLVNNCCEYAYSDPAGLPGHNLMVIIHKLDTAIGFLCD